MLRLSTLSHKQEKSQKQHLKILWGRGEGGGATYRAEDWGPSKTNMLVKAQVCVWNQNKSSHWKIY